MPPPQAAGTMVPIPIVGPGLDCGIHMFVRWNLFCPRCFLLTKNVLRMTNVGKTLGYKFNATQQEGATELHMQPHRQAEDCIRDGAEEQVLS
jgi:hypothetical protein